MRNTAPLGCLRLANDFLISAARVQAPPQTATEALRQKISMPAYFLVGHSIELAMKAFLLGRGLSASKLRSKHYGHDLIALLEECRRRKLGIEVSMARAEVDAVRLLSECYAAKEFEYRVTGFRRLPSYALVYSIATKLCAGLKSYVHRIGA